VYLCPHPAGVSLPGPAVAPTGVAASLTPANLAAARRDAARMNIGWAVVWKRNGSVTTFLLNYLHATGFHFAYLYPHHVKDAMLVYKRA